MSDTKQDSFVRRTTRNLVSGTITGVAGTFVGHPFDTLKVRLQTQPVHNPVYSGVIDCFRKTLKWEGFGGLYKGVGSPLMGQMVFRATLFTSYYQITKMLGGPDNPARLSRGQYFVAGMCTGFVSALVEGPVDLIKTKMQIQIIRDKTGRTVEYRNVFHAGYVITKTYGIRGLYQGLQGTWCRNIPALGVFFCMYEILRDYFTPHGGSVVDLSAGAQLVCGGVAGVLYWVATYPTDVIKSALQSDESDVSKRKYRGYADCAKQLWKNEGGLPRFFKGYIPCMMRALPANAVMILVLESCRKYLP